MRVTPKSTEVLVWDGSNQDDIKAAVEQSYGVTLTYTTLNPGFEGDYLLSDEETMLSIFLSNADVDAVMLTPGRPMLVPVDYVSQWYDTVPE